MPRTKQVKEPTGKAQERKNLLMQQCREQEAALLAALNEEDLKLTNLEADSKMLINLFRDDMAPYLNVLLSDLDAMSASLSVTNSFKKRGRPKMKRSISDTAINDSNAIIQFTSSKTSSDSGNSTSSNMSRSTSRSTQRSGSTNRTATKKLATESALKNKRRSRSLSRNGKPGSLLNFGNARSTMRTPLGAPRNQIMTPITPKMKNYDSHPAVMRRPMQNEIAVSLQGSPLMVNAVMTDGINANIPLADGRVIALQPQNMRFSDIADISLEAQSISDLQQLRDNITKLCDNYAQSKHRK